ncbi:hypothetical protein EDD85DRAFT_937713 [Armillaria nabsnona]|nr:hypothetical protein EDD85DRAFT_937713 [Armillaria nabsnona]
MYLLLVHKSAEVYASGEIIKWRMANQYELSLGRISNGMSAVGFKGVYTRLIVDSRIPASQAVSGIHVLSTCNSKVASERTISSQVKSYSLHLQGRKKIEYDLVRRSFARYPPSNVSSISLYVLILRGHRIYITRSYLICTTSLAIIHEAIASGLPNARGAWFWLTSWAPNTKLETIGLVPIRFREILQDLALPVAFGEIGPRHMTLALWCTDMHDRYDESRQLWNPTN